MKNFISKILLLLVVLTTFTSCEVIGDIFQAGMAVGIIVIILIVALIFWIIRKFRK